MYCTLDVAESKGTAETIGLAVEQGALVEPVGPGSPVSPGSPVGPGSPVFPGVFNRSRCSNWTRRALRPGLPLRPGAPMIPGAPVGPGASLFPLVGQLGQEILQDPGYPAYQVILFLVALHFLLMDFPTSGFWTGPGGP